MRKLTQSIARSVMVLLVQTADHVTGATGLTLTITASKAGGAFAGIAPAVTERGSGWYSVELTSSHTDTLGDLALHITATGADPLDVLFDVLFDVSSSEPCPPLPWSSTLELVSSSSTLEPVEFSTEASSSVQ